MHPSGCETHLDYVSTGCNRSPHCLDWGSNGLIAYGAHTSVAICEPEASNHASRVVQIISEHTERVNCVQWLHTGYGMLLISGSTDKTVCVYTQEKQAWVLLQRLSGHCNSVTSVACHENTGSCQSTLIASSSADSTVRIWSRTRGSSEFTSFQCIPLGNGFALSLAFGALPVLKCPMLACGHDSSQIQLYTLGDRQFEKCVSLVGHEDWVQALSFCSDDNGDLLLASAAQDCYIRIWRISQPRSAAVTTDFKALELSRQSFESIVGASTCCYEVVLESVLTGHEGWIYGLQWHPRTRLANGVGLQQPLCLISASMDKTVILWQYDMVEDVWIDQARMGEVGGNGLGLFGCCFSPDGRCVVAHGYHGALQLWQRDAPEGSRMWRTRVAVGGHFDAVQDVQWDPDEGQFILSVSLDQTARLHAPWRRNGKETTWHEISRPQIHGHCLNCVAMVTGFKYVCGAEEKVIRAFEAPRSQYKSLAAISGSPLSATIHSGLPLGASVPPLGLSNKAVYEGDIATWKEDVADTKRGMKASAFASEDPAPFRPVSIAAPPPEDILVQNTLWPETQKLYGHGNEIFSLACNHRGSLVASACKASKADMAAILIWCTSTWSVLDRLTSHSLTVTDMAFSTSDEFLLSVSRDRTWSLFRESEERGTTFQRIHASSARQSLHTRIIWCCAWTWDDACFLTASRDKKVIAWCTAADDPPSSASVLELAAPVTAVAACPTQLEECQYLVVWGCDDGSMGVCRLALVTDLLTWTSLCLIDRAMCPTTTVKRIRWRRKTALDASAVQQQSAHADRWSQCLAVCSCDHTVRVLSLTLLPW